MKKTVFLILSVLALLILALFIQIRTIPYAISNANGNLAIEIPEAYTSLPPGQALWFTVKLLNLASTERRDVTLTYEIIGSDGNSIVTTSETVAVETQASFVSSLLIPATTQAGTYTLRVTLTDKMLADPVSSESSFVVFSEEQQDYKDYISLPVIAIAVAVLVLICIMSVIHHKRLILKWNLRRHIRSVVRARFAHKTP